MKKNKTINELTIDEYRGYFEDILGSQVRKGFGEDKMLVHVVYQPPKLELNHEQVSTDTYLLFKDYKYVEVLEQTYKQSRTYNYAGYINGYHSHIIMREADFKLIREELSDLNIKDILVYTLDGLMCYLQKQVGFTYTRLLPTLNLPNKITEVISNEMKEKPSTAEPIKAIPNKVTKKLTASELIMAAFRIVKKIVSFIKNTIIIPVCKGFTDTKYISDS